MMIVDYVGASLVIVAWLVILLFLGEAIVSMTSRR